MLGLSQRIKMKMESVPLIKYDIIFSVIVKQYLYLFLLKHFIILFFLHYDQLW